MDVVVDDGVELVLDVEDELVDEVGVDVVDDVDVEGVTGAVVVEEDVVVVKVDPLYGFERGVVEEALKMALIE